MSNLEENSSTKINVQPDPVADSTVTEGGDHKTEETANGGGGGGSDGGISGIVRRSKREDLLKKLLLGLRGFALIFSLISFIITASNKQGDGRNFDEYEEYKYLLAVAIFSFVYTGVQAILQVWEFSTGKQLLKPRFATIIDFSGDQIMAYLLISSASSAIPNTDRMSEDVENAFTDSSSAAISMSFFAFLCTAVSAIISGYRLSTQPYI